MAGFRVVVVGAGPAGVRAAQTLVEAGIQPVVIDEAERAGGQIYRRQPRAFKRSHEKIYGADSAKAQALHDAFDALSGRVDYRPNSLVWAVQGDRLHVLSQGASCTIAFDALILATGATDRLAPIEGWTLPGTYSLGGAQIALKSQACSIGARPVFLGTGPLLYLVAYQYLKAGVQVAAVLDTSPLSAQLAALRDLAVRPGLLARGLLYRMRLMVAGVRVESGVEPSRIDGRDGVRAVFYRSASGEAREVECDAVGMGFHLRSESQLADLAGCPFVFDPTTSQWRPAFDADGRSPRKGVYLAGDGARVMGADAAEAEGRLAAFAALGDLGLDTDAAEATRLRARLGQLERFRRGLATAFPWPARLAASAADSVVVCRCEGISAGDIRRAASELDAPELNRAKALSRIGMGRCQGRFCGSAAAEILADARGVPLEEVGRLRGAAPVKPLTMAAECKDQA